MYLLVCAGFHLSPYPVLEVIHKSQLLDLCHGKCHRLAGMQTFLIFAIFQCMPSKMLAISPELEVKYFINPLPLTICIKLLVIKCILAAYDSYQLIKVSTQTDERLSCSRPAKLLSFMVVLVSCWQACTLHRFFIFNLQSSSVTFQNACNKSRAKNSMFCQLIKLL